MSDSSTVMAAALKPRLRPMSKHELPDGLQTNPRIRGLDGVDEPPRSRLRQRIGWVAEVQGRTVGSLVYAVVWPMAVSPGADSLRSLLRLLRRLVGRRGVRPLHLELLDVTVGPIASLITQPTRSGVRPLAVELFDVTAAPAPFWEAVERALLGRWVKELQCSCGRAPLVVPESNLAVQFFLRDARYRAVRVLKDYYGDEDGYLMAQAAP